MQFIIHAVQGDLGEAGQSETASCHGDHKRLGAISAHIGTTLALSVTLSLLISWYTAGRSAATIRILIQIVSILPIFLFICLIIQWDDYVWRTHTQRERIQRPSGSLCTFRTAQSAVEWRLLSWQLTGPTVWLKYTARSKNSIVQVRGSGFIVAAKARGTSMAPYLAKHPARHRASWRLQSGPYDRWIGHTRTYFQYEWSEREDLDFLRPT